MAEIFAGKGRWDRSYSFRFGTEPSLIRYDSFARK